MKLIWGIIFLLGLVGCKGFGTSTGNPFADSRNNDLPYADEVYLVPTENLVSEEIAKVICEQLARCGNDQVEVDCQSDVQNSEQITATIGLDKTLYPTLGDAEVDEDSFTLHPDRDSANFCLTEIRDLSCDNYENENPLAHIEDYLQNNSHYCGQVY